MERKDCFTEGEEEAAANTTGWDSILKIPGIPLLFSIYFLTFLAFSLFYAGLPIYANSILDWSAVELGIFLAYSSFIMVIVQGPVLSALSKKTSNFTLVLVGLSLLGLTFLMLTYENLTFLYVANTLLSCGNGIMWPSFLSLLSSSGTKSLQGAIQGYGTSMGSIASMFGLILGGILFESIATFVFTIGGLVFFVITALMVVHRFRNKNNPETVRQVQFPLTEKA